MTRLLSLFDSRYIPNIWERIDLPLNTNRYATQLLSGHGNFKAKLASFRLVEDPWCATCGEGIEETAWHVLAECLLIRMNAPKLTEFWNAHSGENRREILCWNPEFFRVFTRVARKVGRAKEGRGLDVHQE